MEICLWVAHVGFGMLCAKCIVTHIEQAKSLRATAHGVHLASIRLEWVLMLRSSAHGVLLESIRQDQVADPVVDWCRYLLQSKHRYDLKILLWYFEEGID
jgi:hypothetical protein